MNFFGKSKKFTISDRERTYRVRYLGNVQTALMKGEGCADKATAVLWNNHRRNSSVGIDMKLTVTASGLKALTVQQGLTEYWSHRITYCIAHPKYPRLFVWVYRHETTRMKVELRCHAALCSSVAKSKAMAVELHDKLAVSLSEFVREKARRQTSRLVLQRNVSMPLANMGLPVRTKFLSTGQNFKPPIQRSRTAPKLCDITEDREKELLEEEEEKARVREEKARCTLDSLSEGAESDYERLGGSDDNFRDGMFEMEMGNDIDELRKDERVKFILQLDDSDDNSSESGFSEVDREELASAGSGSSGESVVSHKPIPSFGNNTPTAVTHASSHVPAEVDMVSRM